MRREGHFARLLVYAPFCIYGVHPAARVTDSGTGLGGTGNG